MAVIASRSHIHIIQGGNILDADESIIIHQCNCKTTYGRGLSSLIFRRFPESNIYAQRAGATSTPGTIHVAKCEDEKTIIGIFAQYYPSRARYANDTPAKRLTWFRQGLDAIEFPVDAPREVAMPYNIGCGLAGGHWPTYYNEIMNWAIANGVYVALYDFDNAHT